MKVKKAIKRIAALATGATMVAATISGAVALDLSDYPAPFVENGVYNGKIVIGQSGVAQVSDVLGAIDIAASLQAAAKSPVGTDGLTTSVSVTGGAQIKSSSEDFNMGDELDDFETGGIYDDDNFPDLLEDGILEDEDGDEYDFEQTVVLGDAQLLYDQNDDYGDDPVFHLDIGGATTAEMIYHVHFKDTVDAEELDDSETIDVFGRSYTFDPDNANGDDFVLYGSDRTVIVSQDEAVTVEVDGEEYTIEVLGGNSDDSTAIIRVTGSTYETKTLERGDSQDMAGLDIYVDDVFISNIGAATISVSIFVGSNEIVIPDASTTWDEIELNGETETNIEGKVTGTVSALTDIYFKVDPTEFDDPSLGPNDEWDLLPMGDAFVDPLFGFSLAFDGMTPAVDSREMTELARNGDVYTLTFVSNGGDEVEMEIVEATSATTVTSGENGLLVLGVDTIAEDEFFILEDTETDVGDRETYVLELTDVDEDDNEFTLKNIGEGTTETYEDGEEIEDTGVFGFADGHGGSMFMGSDNATGVDSLSRFVAREGLVINLDFDGTAELDLNITEDTEDMDEAALEIIELTIDGDATDDIIMTEATWNISGNAQDTDGDYVFGMSEYGTWFEQEREDNGEYLRLYYGADETDFHILLNGPDAIVISSSTGGGAAYSVNELVVGQIALYDNEAMGLLGSTPLISVGGPCVNTVSMELMGNPEVCWEGFDPGKGKIKFWDSQSALMVAGYGGDDTIGGCYVLADYGSYDLIGDEVEVIVTDLSDLEVQAVV